MGSQQFCLRWNNHQVNMLNVFETLLQNEALVDVTLACEGVTLKAHKVVLSACSPYFQAMFIENPCKHPIVILKDVRYSDLKALIDFMYKGQVNVGQDQLNAFLNTAEALKIKGLAEVTGGGASCINTTLEPKGGSVSSSSSRTHSQQQHQQQQQQQQAASITAATTLSSSSTSSPPLPPALQLTEPKLAHLPPPPQLQPLSNASSVPYLPSSPPPKRRKTKPRKRIPESALISSDQEDSDALDLATTTPDVAEASAVDLQPESSSEGERGAEPTETKPPPTLHDLHQPPTNLSPHIRPPTLSESTEDTNSNMGEKFSEMKYLLASQIHYDNCRGEPHASLPFPSTNQNQFSGSVAPPSVHTQQRLQILPKPPLISVLPPCSSSPLPSTSTTQASIQDPAGWPERKKREYHCEHCQQCFESKKVFYKHGCPRIRVGFTCDVCGSFFPTHCRYSRHRQIHNPDREIYSCFYCPKTMVRMDHLKQHMKNAHAQYPSQSFMTGQNIFPEKFMQKWSGAAPKVSQKDIRRLCHFTRQSQKHKSPWTEEDMVAALESVQCGRLTYALAARKFDIPKATLHYYVILMKAVEAVRSGRMTPEIAAIKYNVRASILIGCLYGADLTRAASPPSVGSDRNDVFKKEA